MPGGGYIVEVDWCGPGRIKDLAWNGEGGSNAISLVDPSNKAFDGPARALESVLGTAP